MEDLWKVWIDPCAIVVVVVVVAVVGYRCACGGSGGGGRDVVVVVGGGDVAVGGVAACNYDFALHFARFLFQAEFVFAFGALCQGLAGMFDTSQACVVTSLLVLRYVHLSFQF